MTTMCYDHRIIDLDITEYRIKTQTFQEHVVDYWVTKFQILTLIIGIVIGLGFFIKRSLDPIFILIHSLLTIDCYRIQAAYYFNEWIGNLQIRGFPALA